MTSRQEGALKNIPLNRRDYRHNYRIIRRRVGGFDRKMQKQQESVKKRERGLDGISKKRKRGRPRQGQYPEILARAENYRGIFTEIWQSLCGPLQAARNEKEVTEAFRSHGEPYAQEFVPRLEVDILTVLREKKFPKRARAQIKFFANSLAGRPVLRPRTSRDICASGFGERNSGSSPHRILRKEYYIECSCGFAGPALNSACRKCGAQISILPDLFLGLP